MVTTTRAPTLTPLHRAILAQALAEHVLYVHEMCSEADAAIEVLEIGDTFNLARLLDVLPDMRQALEEHQNRLNPPPKAASAAVN